MKVFHWNKSETLKRYACGDVIVVAETVEQAREKAVTDFVAWIEKPESYYNFMVSSRVWWDNDDAEAYYELIEKFKIDISEEPIELQDTIFIMGSE